MPALIMTPVPRDTVPSKLRLPARTSSESPCCLSSASLPVEVVGLCVEILRLCVVPVLFLSSVAHVTALRETVTDSTGSCTHRRTQRVKAAIPTYRP